MTAPAKLVQYLADEAERHGALDGGDRKVKHREVVAKAAKVIVRRMTKDAKRIEELEAALDRVLSEANHALVRTVERAARHANALTAIEDFAQAALKRGPYARRRGRVERVEDPGPSSDRKRVTEDDLEIFRDTRMVFDGALTPR